jgi:hypothetical protein
MKKKSPSSNAIKFQSYNFDVSSSASNPGDDVSEVVLSLSHQRGKQTNKKKTQNKTKNPTKCPKFNCSTVSVSFSACQRSSVVVSSNVGGEKRKKNRAWRQFCEWYLWLWLTCPLLSACCCWRLYSCRSQG